MNEKPVSFLAPAGMPLLRESQSTQSALGRLNAVRAEDRAKQAVAKKPNEDEEVRALIEAMAGGPIGGDIKVLNG